MTNKPMLSVERELLERAASAIEKHYGSLQWVIASELRALLDKEVDFLTPDCPDCACVQDGHCLCIPSKPAAQHHGKPVAKLHAERLTGKDGEYGVTVEDSEWFNSCRQTGGIFNLYAEPPAPVATGTASDKYKAELYDEVWQKARDMGYNNVTDALSETPKKVKK